jgi:hypothetical protein
MQDERRRERVTDAPQRRRAKNQRSGCLFCKPYKREQSKFIRLKSFRLHAVCGISQRSSSRNISGACRQLRPHEPEWGTLGTLPSGGKAFIRDR